MLIVIYLGLWIFPVAWVSQFIIFLLKVARAKGVASLPIAKHYLLRHFVVVLPNVCGKLETWQSLIITLHIFKANDVGLGNGKNYHFLQQSSRNLFTQEILQASLHLFVRVENFDRSRQIFENVVQFIAQTLIKILLNSVVNEWSV